MDLDDCPVTRANRRTANSMQNVNDAICDLLIGKGDNPQPVRKINYEAEYWKMLKILKKELERKKRNVRH